MGKMPPNLIIFQNFTQCTKKHLRWAISPREVKGENVYQLGVSVICASHSLCLGGRWTDGSVLGLRLFSSWRQPISAVLFASQPVAPSALHQRWKPIHSTRLRVYWTLGRRNPAVSTRARDCRCESLFVLCQSAKNRMRGNSSGPVQATHFPP